MKGKKHKPEQIIRKLDARIERLLRKAFLDAGLPRSLVADAELQWRDTGFLPGVDLASRYSTPDQCRRFRRLHVRVSWRERKGDGELYPLELAGPFCVGSGRFTGLGLFVSRSIVKDAGGDITLESEVGRGTTVRVTLPAAAAR